MWAIRKSAAEGGPASVELPLPQGGRGGGQKSLGSCYEKITSAFHSPQEC